MKRKKEYSKTITTIVVTVFSLIAIAFIVFVCYEMHRQNDLSPVAFLGPSIVGLLATIIGFYMWRAKAKSACDLEWEKTKQLTKLRDKYPEAFLQYRMNQNNDEDITGGVG